MKKSSFLEGAMIATIGIVICKIIGLFYVIPFYAIIGTQGGALYTYAYSIYAIFLSLSNSGIPIAMSKVISEYNTLGYHHTKERAYKIGATLIITLGVFFFIILIIFAPMLAKMIIGDAVGGNSIESVTLVIRIVATALLIVPLESVTQGYLQGQKFIFPSSMANIIEQLVRVTIIIAGSFTVIRVFHLSVETAVGISVFAATVGCLVAYFYLLRVLAKNGRKLKRHESARLAEKKITSKDIIKKIICYALPFVVIDVMNSISGMVDTMTVVNTMIKLGYSTQIAETTIGVLATWATKLNMIIVAIALGVSTSLIPHIASANVKKDWKDLNRKVNQPLQALLVTTIPMAIGLSFLATPVWVVFYGFDQLSIDIFRFYILQAISFSFFTVLIDIMQTLNRSKISLGTLFGTVVGKVLLNIPIMTLFAHIGIEAYYGPIVATLLIQSIAITFLLYQLKKLYHVKYWNTVKIAIKTVLCVGIMLLTLMILGLFISTTTTSRMVGVGLSVFYAVVGIIVYLVCAFKSNLIYEVFGERMVHGIIKKIPGLRKKISVKG